MMNITDTPPVRIVVCGHINHGKSTLIGRVRLSCLPKPENNAEADRIPPEFITDHLAEERRYAKTVDTTHICFQSCGRPYILIDTPGHAEFIKNMFTGASRADAALLLIDAAEGISEQTTAHLHILRFLGLRLILPVINKMDRVGYSEKRFHAISHAAATLFRESGIDPPDAIPLSALSGENVSGLSPNMPWYHGSTLMEALDGIPLPERSTDRPLRFIIQGGIEINGKHLQLGRVETGRIRAGQTVMLLPDQRIRVVRSVRTFGSQADSAEAGMCVAVSLSQKTKCERGSILCDPSDPPRISDSLLCRVFWMNRQALAHGEHINVCIAMDT